MADDLI